MSTLRDTKWIYNMTRATSDLSVPRPSVPRGFSPELLGVDGTTQGGLRPHNGFRLAHELDYYGATYPSDYSEAGSLTAQHRVIDFFPISFKKGFKTAYGFVYRVQYVNDGTPANDKSHVFIEYFDPDDNRWYSPKAPDTSVTNTTKNLLMYKLTGELATADMDVQTFGRLVYVFVRGRSPSLFYIDLGTDNAPEGTGAEADEIVVIGVTGANSGDGNTGIPGPGQRPELVNFNEGQPLGELDTVSAATIPGTAQVVLAEEAPSNIGLFGTTGIYTNTNNSFFTSPTSLSVPDANDSGTSDSGNSPQVSEPVTTLLDRRSVSAKHTFVPLDTSLSGDDKLLVLVNLDAAGDTSTYANTIESIVFENGRTATGGVAGAGITLTEIDTQASVTAYQRIHAYELKDADQSNLASGATMNATHAGTIGRSNCIKLTLPRPPLRGEILVYKVTGVPTGDQSIIATSTSSVGLASKNTWGTSEFENPIYRSQLLTYSTGGIQDLTFTFDNDGTTGFDFLTDDAQGPTDAGSARIETLTAAFDSDTANVAGVAFLQFESDTAADYDLVHIPSFSFTASNGLGAGVDAGYSFNDSISTINTTDGSSRRVVGTNGLSGKLTIAQQFQKTMNQSGFYVALDPFTSGSVVLVPIIIKAFGGLNTGTGSNVNLSLVDAGSGGTLNVIDGVGGASNADATNTLGFTVSGGSITVNTFAFVYKYSNTKYQGFQYDLTTKLNRVADNGTGWNSNYLPQQITLALRPATSKVPTSFFTAYTANSDPKQFVDKCSIEYLNPSPNVDGDSTSPPEFTCSWRLKATDFDPPLGDVVYDIYITPDQGAPLAMVAESQPHNGSISKVQKYSVRRGSSPFREIFSKGRLDFGKTYQVKVIARLKTSEFNSPSGLGTKSPGKPGATVEFSTGIGDRTARQIKGGDYAFAYVLYDSKTGRKTSLSDVTSIDNEDFPQVTKFFDQATGNIVDDPTLCCADNEDPGTDCEYECEERLVNADRFVAMEVIYDSNKFDTAYFYRSVRTEDAGGTFTAGYLQLDKIVKLEDYLTSNQPASPTGYKRAVYFYTKEDKGLVWQPSYLGDSVLDEQMPYGGTATMYDNTMVVTSLNNQIASAPGLEEDRVFDEIRGIGEVRYSSLAEYSPELFPPLNRYAPSDPNNEILRLHKVGPYVIGLSRDRAYHFRREGGFIAIREIHEGLIGTVNHKASDVAGSSVYTISSKGVKIVDADGQFKSMGVLDRQIKEEFEGNFDRLQVAFDPFISCLFFYSPPAYSANKKSSTGKASLAWFETSMITQLDDLPFDQVRQGPWPRDEEVGNIHAADGSRVDKRIPDYDGDVVTRALWLQNAPDTSSDTASDSTVHDGSGVTADAWRPRIWVANHKRDRNRVTATSEDASKKVHTLLDIKFDHQFAISGTPSGTTITLNTSSDKLGANAEGAKVYVTKAATAASVGGSYTISKVVDNNDGTTTLTTVETVSGLAAADRVSISPVHFRAVGHNCGVSATQDDMTAMDITNYHRIKQVNDLMATFIDVSGRASSEPALDAYYQGVLFTGSEIDPSNVAQPLDPNGQTFDSISTTLESLYPAVFGTSDTFSGSQGVLGVSLSPGVECFCSDLDYRLLSFRVDGKIQPSETASLSDIDS